MTYLDEVLENIVKKEQQIIKDWNSTSTCEGEFLVFTTLEKELASDKDLHLSTRHKSKVGETHKEGLEEVMNLINSDKFKQDCNRAKEAINDFCKTEGIPFHYKISAEKAKKEETPLGSFSKRGRKIDYSVGKKESQTVEKAPIFTYCKVNKNALEALALRALHGHKKYEIGDDWENFTRVPNGDFEYSNSQFRHALEIGEDTEEEHLVSAAWNAVSRLEIYLRNKNQ